MMNFSIDESTQNKLYLHYAESLSYFNENQIIGIYLFGIQNYDSIFFNEPVSSKLLTISSQLTTSQDLIVESTYHKTLENEYVNFENIFLEVNEVVDKINYYINNNFILEKNLTTLYQ